MDGPFSPLGFLNAKAGLKRESELGMKFGKFRFIVAYLSVVLFPSTLNITAFSKDTQFSPG